jgi:transposase
MIANRSKFLPATPEQRQRAIEMVTAGATLREAAAVVGVSHETIRAWANAGKIERQRRVYRPPPAPAAIGERQPVFIDGVRLGRLALWP